MHETNDHHQDGKSCTGCGEMKPLGDYSTDKRRADGRQSRCKACFNADRRARNAANPEHFRAMRRLDYERNGEKYRALRTASRRALYGEPKRIFGDDERRFWSYVEKTDTCWLWTGAKDETGY